MSEEIFPLAEGCRYRTALGVSYCGTGYNGWQTQPDGRTVQDYLERALAKFLAVPAATICAGRTDAGVHGAGQVVHVDSVVCDFARYPYKARTYARQMIIRESNVTERSLVTSCSLQNTGRSDDNPNGFIIEQFTIRENRDIRSVER